MSNEKQSPSLSHRLQEINIFSTSGEVNLCLCVLVHADAPPCQVWLQKAEQFKEISSRQSLGRMYFTVQVGEAWGRGYKKR